MFYKSRRTDVEHTRMSYATTFGIMCLFSLTGALGLATDAVDAIDFCKDLQNCREAKFTVALSCVSATVGELLHLSPLSHDA